MRYLLKGEERVPALNCFDFYIFILFVFVKYKHLLFNFANNDCGFNFPLNKQMGMFT